MRIESLVKNAFHRRRYRRKLGGRRAGAELGALVGAATGPAAPIAISVLSLAGGIFGALGGGALGRYIMGITCAKD